jgi:hypothetical protein
MPALTPGGLHHLADREHEPLPDAYSTEVGVRRPAFVVRSEEIRLRDVIWFPPSEKHCHGASPTTAMTHIAIQE